MDSCYYLCDSTGRLNCVDAATGEAVYSAERLADIKRLHASSMAAAGRLYFTGRRVAVAWCRLGANSQCWQQTN
ncbi:MAG: hypothetical protein ACI835_003636 [Planctomycetota bacterium]|jgi:hypothetical protein